MVPIATAMCVCVRVFNICVRREKAAHPRVKVQNMKLERNEIQGSRRRLLLDLLLSLAWLFSLRRGNNQLHSPLSFLSLASGRPGATSHKDTVRTGPLAYKRQGPVTGLLHTGLCFSRWFHHLIRERGGTGSFVGRQSCFHLSAL